jgi:hypothetical protein
VDVDGDDTFSVGDVLLGFARIDDHAAPTGAFGPLGNRVYSIFTQQVAAINPTGSTHQIVFEPTTAAGLTLTDIIGVATPANSFSAVYDNPAPFPTDLINASPGDVDGNGTINLFDYFAEIINEAGPAPQPSFITGLRPGQATVGLTGPTAALPDYLIANTTVTGSVLITVAGSLASLPTLGLGIVISNFTGGMEITVNNDPNVSDYARVVAATESVLVPDAGDPSGFIRHDLAIVGGNVVGSAGAVNAAEWDNVNPNVAYNSPGGFVTNADFVVHPLLAEIPEPTAFLVWLVGLLMAGIYRSERQQ